MLGLHKPLNQWLLLLFLAFLWGSSFILMKKALLSYDYTQVASLRILISFVVLSPVLIRNFKHIHRKQWIKIFIAGLLGSGIPAYLFTLAQTKISSSLAGMLNSTVPLFAVVIGVVFFGIAFRRLKLFGVVVGLIGTIGLLAVSNASGISSEYLGYGLLVVLATLCYATNVNFIKSKLQEVSSLNISSFGFLLIGPIAGIHLFTTDFTTVLSEGKDAPLHLLYVCILAVFGTAIAVILFNMLIKQVSAVFASSVTYIIPIFAMIWGFADGERIDIAQICFILIILIGVYIINKDNQLERSIGSKKSKEKIN